MGVGHNQAPLVKHNAGTGPPPAIHHPHQAEPDPIGQPTEVGVDLAQCPAGWASSFVRMFSSVSSMAIS
jgi:hypothetical protein